MPAEQVQTPQADPQQILQFLIAEHTALQTARSATIFESGGRISAYLATLSSAVVALAFVGQVSEMGQPFFAFTLLILPTVFVVGLSTFYRVLQSGTEDFIYARAINQIRQYYLETAPHMRRYFLLDTRADSESILNNMGVQTRGWRQMLLTAAGLVSIINSIVLGVLVGLATLWLNPSLLVAVGAGCGVAAGSIFMHTRWMRRQWQRADEMLDARQQHLNGSRANVHETLNSP